LLRKMETVRGMYGTPESGGNDSICLAYVSISSTPEAAQGLPRRP